MCIEKWRDSHDIGDLNDRNTLRQAMAFRNFQDSPANIRSVAEAALQGLDCAAAMDGRQFKPTVAQCCNGEKSAFEGNFAYLAICKKDLFPIMAGGAAVPVGFMADILRDIRRNVLFVSDWCNENGEPSLASPEHIDCTALADALGLYGLNWRKGTEVAIFSLKISQAHKPTWLDSGLAFYWYAAPHLPRFGLTRSLKTGRPALREWVIPRHNGDFEVINYWRPKVVKDCMSPDDPYWEACLQELRP